MHPQHLPEHCLAMRDLMDGQLVTADERLIGRVADVMAAWRPDGTLVLTDLLIGPQALAGRVSSRLRPLARWLLRDRFEYTLPVTEIAELKGGDVRLRGSSEHYTVGHADEWVQQHILRFIPGNGGKYR